MIPNSLGSTCEVWTSKKATLSLPNPRPEWDGTPPVQSSIAFVPRSLGLPQLHGPREPAVSNCPPRPPSSRPHGALPCQPPAPGLRASERSAGFGPSPASRPLTSFGTSWFSSPGTIAQTPTARLRPACGGRVEVAAARCLRREGQRQSSSQPPELPQPRRPRLRP